MSTPSTSTEITPTESKRDWRGTREFNRRKNALQKIIDGPNAEPKDVFRAMEMLDAHVGIPELKAEVTRLTGEVERLTAEATAQAKHRAELVAEVARLTAELAESENAGNEALDMLEREHERA